MQLKQCNVRKSKAVLFYRRHPKMHIHQKKLLASVETVNDHAAHQVFDA